MKLKLSTLLAASLALFSCSAPSSQNFYLKSSDILPGSFDFSLDFTDTLSTYDLYFYAGIEQPLQLTVRWLSPSDSLWLAESVWMKSVKENEVKQLYRSRVRPPECGVWRICVSLLNPECKQPDGLGIISQKRYGAR